MSAWGFFLPAGVVVARMLRHRPPLWFYLHIGLQMFGLTCALAGFAMALSEFSVFEEHAPKKSTRHGTLGLVVMSLGLLQPLNALIRPHAPGPGAVRPLKRLLWEVWHKGSGLVAIILSIPTVVLGTQLITKTDTYQAAYGAAWGAVVLLALGLFVFDRKARQQAKLHGVELN